MILVSTLYDEYIDRPKLTEQKKPFEYIAPSPSRGARTIKVNVYGPFYGINLYESLVTIKRTIYATLPNIART